MGRRDRLDIIADILSISLERSKKTRIMYQANLSWTLVCKYLDEVTTAGFVNLTEKDGDYIITPKGIVFLKEYKSYCSIKKIAEEKVQNAREKLEEIMPPLK